LKKDLRESTNGGSFSFLTSLLSWLVLGGSGGRSWNCRRVPADTTPAMPARRRK
jgi:hypothetical protein